MPNYCKYYFLIFNRFQSATVYPKSHMLDEPAWAFLVKHFSRIEDTLCRNRCPCHSMQTAVAKNTVWLTAAPAAAPDVQFHWEDFHSCRELTFFLHSHTPSFLAPTNFSSNNTGMTRNFSLQLQSDWWPLVTSPHKFLQYNEKWEDCLLCLHSMVLFLFFFFCCWWSSEEK